METTTKASTIFGDGYNYTTQNSSGVLAAFNITDEDKHPVWHGTPPLSTTLMVMGYLKLYFTPSVVSIGVIGNTISCITLLHSKLKNFSSSHYLVAICVVNTTLLLSFLLKWLSIHGVFIHNRPGLCQVTSFIQNSSIFLSNWYVVAFCVDRYITLCWPTEGMRLCTKVRARTVITGLIIVSAVIYINLSITVGVVELEPHQRKCMTLPFFHHNARLLTTIVAVLNVLLPYTCILLLSLLITFNVYVMQSRDVFSDDNSPSLLKQTTAAFMVLFFVFHWPYELYHVIHIIRAIVNENFRPPPWEQFFQRILMYAFDLSLIVHIFVYIFTYPLFRNYLKQNCSAFCHRLLKGKCSEQCSCSKGQGKQDRNDIEFSGVNQNDETVV